MNRKEFLIQTSLAAAGAFIPFKKWLPVQKGNFQLLRRNVGTFTGRGGTIGWLASDEAMVIVDSQFPSSAKNCLSGLQQKTSHGLNLLVNTHHHGDHTAGNPVLKPKAKKSLGHKNVPILMRQAAEEGETNLAVPEITYNNNWSMEAGDEIVHATHFGRAHTAGDSVIYFEKANVVHVGDLVFNRMNPYTDRPAGASIHHWIKVLSAIKKQYPDDTIFIFGHSKPEYGITGNKEDIGVMKSYLTAMVEHVENGIERGLTKKEIVTLKQLPGFENFLYADFWSLQQNLGVVYAEITKQKWLPVKSEE